MANRFDPLFAKLKPTTYQSQHLCHTKAETETITDMHN